MCSHVWVRNVQFWSKLFIRGVSIFLCWQYLVSRPVTHNKSAIHTIIYLHPWDTLASLCRPEARSVLLLRYYAIHRMSLRLLNWWGLKATSEDLGSNFLYFNLRSKRENLIPRNGCQSITEFLMAIRKITSSRLPCTSHLLNTRFLFLQRVTLATLLTVLLSSWRA